MPTIWITNVPCAVGCRAASQETAPVRERRQDGNARHSVLFSLNMRHKPAIYPKCGGVVFMGCSRQRCFPYCMTGAQLGRRARFPRFHRIKW